jgi:hypothetical protein
MPVPVLGEIYEQEMRRLGGKTGGQEFTFLEWLRGSGQRAAGSFSLEKKPSLPSS